MNEIEKVRVKRFPNNAYLRYCYEWHKSHWHDGYDGCSPICFEEFLANEYLDEEIMKEILPTRDFNLWHQINMEQ